MDDDDDDRDFNPEKKRNTQLLSVWSVPFTVRFGFDDVVSFAMVMKETQTLILNLPSYLIITYCCNFKY